MLILDKDHDQLSQHLVSWLQDRVKIIGALAMALNIPREIIDKKPSAGLWKGQSDEDELGFSYQEVDNYLLNGESSQQVTSTIEQLQNRNRHKLEPPAIPNIK